MLFARCYVGAHDINLHENILYDPPEFLVGYTFLLGSYWYINTVLVLICSGLTLLSSNLYDRSRYLWYFGQRLRNPVRWLVYCRPPRDTSARVVGHRRRHVGIHWHKGVHRGHEWRLSVHTGTWVKHRGHCNHPWAWPITFLFLWKVEWLIFAAGNQFLCLLLNSRSCWLIFGGDALGVGPG